MWIAVILGSLFWVFTVHSIQSQQERTSLRGRRFAYLRGAWVCCRQALLFTESSIEMLGRSDHATCAGRRCEEHSRFMLGPLLLLNTREYLQLVEWGHFYDLNMARRSQDGDTTHTTFWTWMASCWSITARIPRSLHYRPTFLALTTLSQYIIMGTCYWGVWNAKCVADHGMLLIGWSE